MRSPAGARAGDGAGAGGKGTRRSDTRERILDVALDLFNEQGYDKTSLREVSEKLGVTKAALYYHFARKEDILLALHVRIHDINAEIVAEVEAIEGDGPIETAAWLQLVDRLVDQVVANRKLFALHARNHDAIEEVHERGDYPRGHGPGRPDEQTDPETLFRRLLSDPRIPAPRRISMACSLGAALGTLLAAGGLLGDVTDDEVVTEVRRAVRQIVASDQRR